MNTELPLVLALDVAGNPDRWVTHQDVAYYKAKDLIIWEQGIEDYTIRGGYNNVSGKRSELSINTIVAVRGRVITKHLHERYNRPSLTNRALFRRDHHVCAYCGESFTSSDLTRDHIHPTSKGGLNIWENVVTSCKGCNKRKDNKLLSQIDMDLLYIPYVPCRSEYLILMNRSILADQMEFLKTRVPEHSRVHSYKLQDLISPTF